MEEMTGKSNREEPGIDQKSFDEMRLQLDEIRQKLSENFRTFPIKSENAPAGIIPGTEADKKGSSPNMDTQTVKAAGLQDKSSNENLAEVPVKSAKSGISVQTAVSQSDKAEEASGALMFAEGLFHGAIENPVNGVVQIANHLGAKLPELHLVDEEDINNSSMGMLGTMAGETVEFFALTAVTGGFGSALRMGAAAAAYAGILQPSDSKSNTFAEDRLKQAGVAGLSGFGMGMAALKLSPYIATPELRSFGQSLFYGGVSGGAGGLIHAEADAIINKQSLLPSYQDFGTDLFGGVAFGAALGGLGHISNAFKASLKAKETGASRFQANLKTIDTGDSLLQFKLGEDGQPVQVFLKSNKDLAYFNTAKIGARKLANGSWESVGFTKGEGIIAQAKPEAAIINASLNPSGGVTLTLDKFIQDGISPISVGQVNRTFLPGQSDSAFWSDLSTRDPGQRFAAWASPFARALFAGALSKL